MPYTEINIYGQIGIDVNGSEIAEQIRMSDSDVLLKINSSGGSVEDGFSIISEILNKGNVDIYITGLALSMGGVIAMAGRKVKMNDFARIMVHNASGGEGENAKKALKQINEMLASVLSRKGFNKEKMLDYMKMETWIGAEEAKNAGLIDEIVKTKVAHKAEQILRQQKEPAELVKEISNIADKPEGVKVINFNNENKLKMTNEFLNLLDAPNEGKAYTKVQNVLEENENLKNEVTKLKNEKKELESSVKETKKAVAESIIDTAIGKGVIKKDSRDSLLNEYSEKPETLKTLVNSINVDDKGKIDNLTSDKQEPQEETNDTLAKEYEDLIQDPGKAQNLMDQNPERFEKLYNAYLNA